jgi:hypothetical protein
MTDSKKILTHLKKRYFDRKFTNNNVEFFWFTHITMARGGTTIYIDMHIQPYFPYYTTEHIRLIRKIKEEITTYYHADILFFEIVEY